MTADVDPTVGDRISDVDLIAATFRFLLEREPSGSILSEFDLSVISRYFPDYESRVGEYVE